MVPSGGAALAERLAKASLVVVPQDATDRPLSGEFPVPPVTVYETVTVYRAHSVHAP